MHQSATPAAAATQFVSRLLSTTDLSSLALAPQQVPRGPVPRRQAQVDEATVEQLLERNRCQPATELISDILAWNPVPTETDFSVIVHSALGEHPTGMTTAEKKRHILCHIFFNHLPEYVPFVVRIKQMAQREVDSVDEAQMLTLLRKRARTALAERFPYLRT